MSGQMSRGEKVLMMLSALALALFITLVISNPVEAAWANESFSYCKNITVTENSGMDWDYWPVIATVSFDHTITEADYEIAVYDEKCEVGGSLLAHDVINTDDSSYAEIIYLLNLTASSSSDSSIYYKCTSCSVAPDYSSYSWFTEDSNSVNNTLISLTFDDDGTGASYIIYDMENSEDFGQTLGGDSQCIHPYFKDTGGENLSEDVGSTTLSNPVDGYVLQRFRFDATPGSGTVFNWTIDVYDKNKFWFSNFTVETDGNWDNLRILGEYIGHGAGWDSLYQVDPVKDVTDTGDDYYGYYVYNSSVIYNDDIPKSSIGRHWLVNESSVHTQEYAYGLATTILASFYHYVNAGDTLTAGWYNYTSYIATDNGTSTGYSSMLDDELVMMDTTPTYTVAAEQAAGADETPPTITVTSPTNTTYDTAVININATTSESADSCLYNLNSGTNYTLTNSSMTNWFTINQTAISNGSTVQLFLYCNDTSGNMGLNSSIWFTFEVQEDLDAPTITVTGPGNQSYTTLPVDINITLSENSSWCVYNLDGGENQSLSTFTGMNLSEFDNNTRLNDALYMMFEADDAVDIWSDYFCTDIQEYEDGTTKCQTISTEGTGMAILTYILVYNANPSFINSSERTEIYNRADAMGKSLLNYQFPMDDADPDKRGGFIIHPYYGDEKIYVWGTAPDVTALVYLYNMTGNESYKTAAENGAKWLLTAETPGSPGRFREHYNYGSTTWGSTMEFTSAATRALFDVWSITGNSTYYDEAVDAADALVATSGGWWDGYEHLGFYASDDGLMNAYRYTGNTTYYNTAKSFMDAYLDTAMSERWQESQAFQLSMNIYDISGDETYWDESNYRMSTLWSYTYDNSSSIGHMTIKVGTNSTLYSPHITEKILNAYSRFRSGLTENNTWFGQTNSSLVDGHTYNLQVYCNDSEGNMGLNSSIWFTYNDPLGPPSITISNPGNQSYTTLPINLNVTTDESADSCLYNLNSGTNYTLTNSSMTNWFVEVDPGADGLYQLLVYCNDTDGNMGLNSSIWFTYGAANYTESYNSNTYDTASETFSIIFNLTEYETITNVTASLIWNETSYSSTQDSQDGDDLTISKTITIPEATNETYVVTFYWNYTIYYIDNSTETVSSGSHTQTIYMLNLTNCTDGTIALNLILRDEDTDALISGNIDVFFLIDTVLEDYDTYKNFSFALVGNDTFSICLLPNTTLYTDSMMQFEAEGYSPRTYYLNDAGLSNTTQNLTLYLASNTTTTLVTMEVLDALGLPEEGIQISIQRYYIDTNTYETVAIVETNFDGEAVSYLTLNTVWYRFTLSRDGIILEQYAPTIITEDSLTFRLTQGALGEFFEYYGSIAHNCTTSTTTNTTTCTVSDTSGLMVSSELYIRRWTSLGYVDVCTTSSTSSTATLVCPLGSISEKIYYYTLTATFSSTTDTLEAGYLDFMSSASIYGDLGILVSMMIMIVMIFIGAYRWEISLVLSAVSIALSWVAGLVFVTASSVMAMFVVMAVTIYKTRSR